MTEQSTFSSLFGSGSFPDITDDVIDDLENAMLYSVDSVFAEYIIQTVHFFQMHLGRFVNMQNLSVIDSHYQKRLLRALRFFRHTLLTDELSENLEDIALKYVKSRSHQTHQFPEPRQQAYVFLIDHFISSPHKNMGKCRELFEWSLEFVRETLQNITLIDSNLYLVVIYSFPYIMDMLPDFIDASNFIDMLLNISIVALNYSRKKDIFFEQYEQIIAKSLRLCSRLIMKYHKISPNTINCLNSLEELLSSDEISYAHVFQNYLMVGCAMIQLNQPNLVDDYPKKIIPFLTKYMPNFVQKPLLQSKKISFYLKTIDGWLERTKVRSINSYVNIIGRIWNLVSSIHGSIITTQTVGEIIRHLISPEIFLENQNHQIILLDNLISSLEIIRLTMHSIDFAKPDPPFKPDVWLESNKEIYFTINSIFQLERQTLSQADLLTKYRLYSLKINLLVRLVKYSGYLLDLAGIIGSQNPENLLASFIHQNINFKDFRDKITKIFDCFIKILTSLNQPLFHNVLNETMIYLLPKQNHRSFHSFFFIRLLKIAEATDHLADFQCIFFSTLADHFEELMYPSAPSILLEVTRLVYQSAFSNEGLTPKQNSMYNDIYRFIIQALGTNNPMIFELLLYMFHHYSRSEVLIKIISMSPFNMVNVLQTLIDEPSMKEIVSLLSLFLFPLCNVQPQSIESWVQLFLPAIESPIHINTAIPALYNYISKNFAQWIGNLKEHVQTSFVSSIISSLSKSVSKDQSLRVLLGRIPDIACKLSLQTIPAKKKNAYVIIDGNKLSIEILFNSIKRNPSPTDDDVNVLFDGCCQYIGSLSFFEASTDQLAVQMIEYIQKKNPQLIETMYTKFSPPLEYAALFLREKYGKSIDDVKIDDPADFLQHISTLCFSRATSKYALHIIELFIDCVDNPSVISRLNSSLLHASQFSKEAPFKVISEQILTRDYSEYPEILNELLHSYQSALFRSFSNVRKTAIKALAILEQRYDVKSNLDDLKQNFFRTIHQSPKNPYHLLFLFNFIFMKPFTDLQSPLECLNKFIEFLRNPEVRIPIISLEIQKLFKKLRCNDQSLTSFWNAKFMIKTIAKLLVTVDQPTNQFQMQQYPPQTQSWMHLIKTFKEIPQLTQLIHYFVKQIKKEAQIQNKQELYCLPSDISLIMTIIGSYSNPEEFKLFRLYIDFIPISNSQNFFGFIQLLSSTVNSYMNIQILGNDPNLFEKSFKEISKINFSKMKQIAPNLDLTPLIQSFIDLTLYFKKNFVCIKTYIYYIANSCAKEFTLLLINNFKMGWNIDLYLLVLDILVNPKVPSLKNTIFEQIISNIKHIFAYLQSFNQEADIILSRALDCICTIINTHEYDPNDTNTSQFDLKQVLQITRKVLGKLKNKTGPIMPNLIEKYIQILLPLRFAQSIDSTPALFSYFKSKIMSFFVRKPSLQLFQHPLFSRRLIQFMKLIDENHRSELYSLTPSPSESKSIIINQIISDRYENFPEQEKIKMDFINYLKTPSFPVLILNYSGAANRWVEVTDLKDSPILTMYSEIYALAIHYKLRNIDCIKTPTRFISIIKALNDLGSRTDDLQQALAERLDATPYMLASSFLCFLSLGQNNCTIDHTSRAITQFILGFSSTLLASAKTKDLDTQFIFKMPNIFKHLYNIKSTCNRVFEIFLNTIAVVIISNSPHYVHAQTIPPKMEQFKQVIDKNYINHNLIDILRGKFSEKPVPDSLSPIRTKFFLQLIPVLIEYLFSQDPNFFPYVLLPGEFYTQNYPKELVSLYQKALKETIFVGRHKAALRIVREAYDYLSKVTNYISKPLQSPLATVAHWMNEIQNNNNPNNAKLMEKTKVLLEALKPTNKFAERRPDQSQQLYFDMISMKQPLHPLITNLLLDLFDNEFSYMTPIISSIGISHILITKQSFDLTNDSWQMDWFSIIPESHIVAFIRLLLPNSLRNFIPFFEENEMKSIVSICLNANPPSNDFSRFMLYYLQHFPHTSLAESFSVTQPFSLMPPLPTLSLYSNVSYFESYNLSEDALGLLKTISPQFLNACSFHQISQFQAAKYYYLESMKNNPSSYFYGLSELRSIDINLSLITKTKSMSRILGEKKENSFTDINLPFYQDTNVDPEKTQNRLTSFISRSYTTSFLHASLKDEIYLSMKMMQQPQDIMNYIDDLVRTSNSMWIKALDRQSIMASNFIWRLTTLNKFLSNEEIERNDNIKKKILNSIHQNHNMIAHLLSQSGATRNALRFYQKSPGPSNIFVTIHNYPRIEAFLRQIPKEQYAPFSKLRSKCGYLMRDFHEVIPKGTKWVKMLFFCISKCPEGVNHQEVFRILFSELINSNNTFHLQFFISMMVFMFKKYTSLINTFSQDFPKLREDIKYTFLRWIPQLFSSVEIPDQLLLSLIKVNPILFKINFDDMNYSNVVSNNPNVKEIKAKIESPGFFKNAKLLKEEKAINEFKSGFSWIEQCQKDIERLDRTVRAHRALYESLSREISQEALDALNFTSKKELFIFCQENPPVFTTDVQITKYSSFSGFKFPNSLVLDVFIEADGTNEAELRFITMKGDSKTFHIVSPDVYGLSQREKLFVEVVSRIIDHNVASKTRSHCTYYPTSYMIHEKLMLIDGPSFISLHGAMQPYSAVRNIYEAASVVSPSECDESPADSSIMKQVNIPTDRLFWWLLEGAEGSQVDFIFMRQSFTSYFAVFSFFQFLFRSRLSTLPSIMLYKDRMRVCLPNFLSSIQNISSIPLTPQICGALSQFILRGTFATSWQIAVDSLYCRKEEIRIFLNSLIPTDITPQQAQQSQNLAIKQRQQLQIKRRQAILSSIQRLDKFMAKHMTEETEKSDQIFPFMLIEHLIQNSTNIHIAQPTSFAWL